MTIASFCWLEVKSVTITSQEKLIVCVSVFYSVLMQPLEDVKQNSKVVTYILSHCGSAYMKCFNP